MSADSQVRVKVYQLDKDTNWTDRGTGFCTLEDCQVRCRHCGAVYAACPALQL
ncbi:hypothetical protein IWW55_002081 [Coemansia sp. RSA 2706]|nr:hypothetical protein IWW55_002081 [Coemansia sp. RSA 2706]